MTSYFDIFSIPQTFDLDLATLESAYFKAQRLFHPDRFVGKPAAEKLAAMQKSMDINQAYDTLKNPLKRAQHLLALHGIIVGTEKDTVKPSPNLLMEIMELREEPQPPEFISGLIAKSQEKISNSYKSQNYEQMAQEVLRLGYLAKMFSESK